MTDMSMGLVELIGGPLDGALVEAPEVQNGEEFLVSGTRREWKKIEGPEPKPDMGCIRVEPWIYHWPKTEGTETVWTEMYYIMQPKARAKFVRILYSRDNPNIGES